MSRTVESMKLLHTQVHCWFLANYGLYLLSTLWLFVENDCDVLTTIINLSQHLIM